MKNYFGINIIPSNESERLNALNRYEILDTPPEGAFNKIASIAVKLFNVPIALVALVDKDRTFFKANLGMEGVSSVDRGMSLCSLAILQETATVFEDALKEPCLLANPLVAGSFGLRFYAGAPLKTRDGYNLGTLCIVDKEPRTFSDKDRDLLENLASVVMDEIELRLSSLLAIRSQEEMFRQVATDIREPLQNMCALPETGVELSSIRTAAKKALDNLNSILVKTPLPGVNDQREESCLVRITEDAIERKRIEAACRGQKIKVNTITRPRILADASKISTAIGNIIGTVIGYSTEGKTIEVKLDSKGASAHIEINDNGPGFEKEQIELLFNKYHQLTIHSDQSSRLGLVMAKEIVQQHNGQLWAESEGAGKGTKYILELPLC